MTAIPDEIFSQEVLADPWSYYGRLREEDPIHWNERHKVWILTRYEDAVWLARRRAELFSAQRVNRDPRPPYPEVPYSEIEAWARMKERQTHNFIDADPPDHTRMRTEVNRHFGPNQVEEHRALARTVTKELLDRGERQGRMEVMEDLAWRLPVGVLYRMLGVPQEDHERVFWLTRKRQESGGTDQDRMSRALALMQEEDSYVLAAVDTRKAQATPDLLSVLANAEKRGAYSEEEVLAFSEFILSTGWSTQFDNIGYAVLNLLRNPDQWKLLVGDPEGLAPTAVEECLRYDGTSSEMQRYAKRDIEYKGHLIRRGDHVIAKQVATNRDPRVFPDAEKFDITRSPNRHLAFGSGIHFCLGQYLARVNMQEALIGLATRFPNLHQEGPIEWKQYPRAYRRVERLPVAW